MIIYEGPSCLDGAPIVAVATGLGGASRNAKTGGMVQVWILRADMSPTEALRSGDDASICGDCIHRQGSCYVQVHNAPTSVWRAYKRGVYPAGTPLALNGLTVRLGAYGDPAAVPIAVWDRWLAGVRAVTGYTHQWRGLDHQALSRYCMASCDSVADREEARAMGWRAFRVRASTEARDTGEVVCPASAEAGHKTTCAACTACGGHSAKARADIVIYAHGSVGKVNAFNRRTAA